MSDRTEIEWSDATWNPVRGCTKVSPGCKHCYAETFAERWRGIPGHAYERGFDPRVVPEMLDQPLRWTRPRTVFVNSMSDLFHADFPREYIATVFGVMAATQRHTYQVLTKRDPREFFRWYEGESGAGASAMAALYAAAHVHPDVDVDMVVPWPLPNVWLGVSVEDRKYGIPRIDQLRETPAAIRFLSVEPLLEDLGEIDLRGIHWVIVGGESGAGARPMDAAWVRSLRDQCEAAGVAFFFKQWGGVRKKAAGRVLDGRTHDAMPGGCA